MGLHLIFTCDHAGCTESAAVRPARAADAEISAHENYPDRNGALFTVETNWLDSPSGWTLDDDHGTFCPGHPATDTLPLTAAEKKRRWEQKYGSGAAR